MSDKTFEMSEAEYHDHEDGCDGVCLGCGDIQEGGVEPDARDYHCEACGESRVYGVPEALMMGLVTIT